MDTKTRSYDMNPFRVLRDGYRQARRDQAVELDQKLVRKALRKSPESPVLIARVVGQSQAQMLLGKGWTIAAHSPTQWGGSDLWGQYLMEKPNPNVVSR